MQKIILQTIATTGLISVALIAPNVLQVLKVLGITPKKRQGETINLARSRLLENGLLVRDESGFLSLSEKGRKKLAQLEFRDYTIKRPRKWDKKWRLLSFDIKEQRKTLRDKVRHTLREVGFIRLHDSLWIFPYPCDDLIALLKADFKIGRELLYIIADTVEGDTYLQKQFHL